MARLWNVYRWQGTTNRGPGRAIRVWQGDARHGPHAIACAHAAGPRLKGRALFARPAHCDPYASDPFTMTEENA